MVFFWGVNDNTDSPHGRLAPFFSFPRNTHGWWNTVRYNHARIGPVGRYMYITYNNKEQKKAKKQNEKETKKKTKKKKGAEEI